MRAQVGDRIVTASTMIDQPPRDGRIVELRHEDGSPPFVVEWSDTGERTLVFPGPDSHVVTGDGGSRVDADARTAAGSAVKTWTVQVRITEEGDATSATAVLAAEAGGHELDGTGRARRNPADPASSVIGDEVAVARALRLLADRLMKTADSDISTSTGSPAHLTS